MPHYTAGLLIIGLVAIACDNNAEGTDAVLDFVDSRYDQTAGLARELWEYAELGYQEVRSSGLLQKTLAAEGFEIEAGVARIPTAFVASYGDDGPVIGILAEFDALPGINQGDVPYRSPIEGKVAGQACGHNLYGAGSVGAAVAVRHWLEESGTAGVVRLYGTPAEEGGSGKVYMVRAGLFDDVDIVLHWHPDDENSAKARTTLANRSAKFRFRGLSAHASAAPDKARSALDGAEAFNYMVNLLREHVPPQTRIHYVITSGGRAPNVVPDFAEVFYYLRHPDVKTLRELWPRLEQAALGAATGTGVKVDWEIIHGNHPVMVNESLARMMNEKIIQVGGIEYSSAEKEFAKTLYPTLTDPEQPLGSQVEVQPYDVSLGYGSTDVGDISIKVPTVGLRAATWVPGTPAHSWQAVAASGMSIGFKGAQVAAKTLALAAIELYKNPDLRAAAKAEHEQRVGSDFVYEALLGDRTPPLDYRN